MRKHPKSRGQNKDLQELLIIKEKISALGDHKEKLEKIIKSEIRSEESHAWRYKTKHSYDRISELRSILYLISSLLEND